MTEANIMSLTSDGMRDIMQLVGYRVETFAGPDGATQLRSATNGVPFMLRFGNRFAADPSGYADATLTAVLQLQAPLPWDALNQWNSSKRFSRLHQNGNLLVLEKDLIVVGGVSRENLRAQVEIWDRVVQELLHYLRAVLGLPSDAGGAKSADGVAAPVTVPGNPASPQPTGRPA